MKKDIRVELLRIIACIAVVWYHIRELPFKVDGELSETAVFFESICTICVMIFFLISGFYIYNKTSNIISDWLSLIKKFFKNIFLPFLLVVIFCIIFHNYLISTDSFIDCIKKVNIKNILHTLFLSFSHYSCNYLPGTCGHLWYIYSYFIILAVYPLTRLFLTKLNRKFVYIVLIIIFVLLVINDYYLFYGNPTINVFFDILHKPIFYSACGSVLYNDFLLPNFYTKSNKIIINKKSFIFSLLIYIISIASVFKVQCAYYLGENNNYVYTSWLSSFSLVMTIAFIIMFYNINVFKFLNDKFNDIIYYFSNKTLYIYLIHYLIITKLLSIGFQAFCHQNFSNIIQYFIYYILYSALILVFSFTIIIVFEKISMLFSKLRR